MRVICLVPSLTETLIECGVNVVGRTRFCIHPQEKVQHIPSVGGTKGVNWQKCAQLQPDLIVFDREENTRDMAASSPFDWVATKINSVFDCANEFNALAEKIKSNSLADHARDWQALLTQPKPQTPRWDQLPGQLAALNNRHSAYQRLEYIIWRDPWMAIGEHTFIHSVLSLLGFMDSLAEHSESYPVLDQAQMDRDDTFYLFSSEPYRFLRYQDGLKQEGYNGAIVDGELYSWFGIRSYRGLKSYLGNP